MRDGEKVLRGLKKDDSTMLSGYQLYHNFIRPHTALNGKTPAQKANVESDEAKWMSLIKNASQHQRFETSS